MPPKTKTQLKDELEQAKRELAEVQAKTQAEVKAVREKLHETERRLKRELEETRQRAMESERELDEAITELSLERDKVESLQASLREARLGGYNHWTGLLDWTTGLDYWTGLLDSPKLQNTTRSVQNRS